LSLIPPGVKKEWDDNDWWTQQLILAYCYGRDVEDMKLAVSKAGF
jgi:hypothetical protein